MSITPAMREYLAEIYTIQQYEFGLPVKSAYIVENLRVSGAAVARMLKRLEAKELLIFEKNTGYIELSVEGTAEAAKGLRWQRVLECFLYDNLGYGWGDVAKKARQMMRSVDDDMIERLSEFLGNPVLSPFGEHIPLYDELMPRCADVCLNQYPTGSIGIVTRIRTSIFDVKQEIGQSGIVPGTNFKIEGRAPFNGPMRLDIAGKSVRLESGLTRAIWIESENMSQTSTTARDVWLWNMLENQARREQSQISNSQ